MTVIVSIFHLTMLGTLLQTNPPVIQAWQVVALLGSIALVVLGAYGTLIIQNRNTTRTLRQRLDQRQAISGWPPNG